VIVDVDVQLIPRRTVEGPAGVGTDLRPHSQVAQEGERAPGDRRADQVEVDRDGPAAQMPGSRSVKERRELGQAAAAPRRCDLRELVAEVVRE
jgi:hypothetical protein